MSAIDQPARRVTRVGGTLAVVLAGTLLAGCSGGGAATDPPTTASASGTSAGTSSGPTTSAPSTADPTGSDPTGSGPTKTATAASTATTAPAQTRSPGAAATENPQVTGPTGPVDGSQEGLLDTIPGSASATCQTVGESARDVRAGSLAVGNFSQMRQDFRVQSGRPGPLVNLYVYPGDAGATLARVTVRPASGGGDGQEFSTVAAEQADEWTYFPLRVGVPTPGTWRLDVEAGSSRGCYLVSFTAG